MNNTWKQNLSNYINKIDNIKEENILNILLKDNNLNRCVIDFFNPNNLQDIVILYNNYIWDFKNDIKSRNIICCNILEGIPQNLIKWNDEIISNYLDVQFSYLIIDDSIDILYESYLIFKHYDIEYDVKNIKIKSLIDKRTKEYKYPNNLSIECRTGLSITSII